MIRKEFRIIGTNGLNQFEFFYIIQTPKGDIYLGRTDHKRVRISYHSSGLINDHYENPPLRSNLEKRLNAFTGIHQVQGMLISKSMFTEAKVGNTPTSKKVTGFVYFDARKFEQHINIGIYLLEPNKFELLSILSKLYSNPLFHVITETNPWIIITLS